QDRGDRSRQGALHESEAPLHRGPALRGADPRPRGEAQAHPAGGRHAEPDQTPLRLPLPHPLPGPGPLLLRERAGPQGDLARPLGRLPGPRLAPLSLSPPGRGQREGLEGELSTVMIAWSGVYHILATPFRDDGALDTEGLPRLVE